MAACVNERSLSSVGWASLLEIGDGGVGSNEVVGLVRAYGEPVDFPKDNREE